MPTNFAPPVNVSPFIRFGRYAMLIAGISYGAFWQSRYTKKELGLKDFKAREKAARDERLAKEKAIKSADPGVGSKESNLPANGEPKAGELKESDAFTRGSGDNGKENNNTGLYNKFIFEATLKTEPKSKMGLTSRTSQNFLTGNQYEIIYGSSETSSQNNDYNQMNNYLDFDNFMFMFGII